MPNNKTSNIYDDDNIPEIDLPRGTNTLPRETHTKPDYNVEPLPESERPRKDGPGGE